MAMMPEAFMPSHLQQPVWCSTGSSHIRGLHYYQPKPTVSWLMTSVSLLPALLGRSRVTMQNTAQAPLSAK